jgi:hypothetical protein
LSAEGAVEGLLAGVGPGVRSQLITLSELPAAVSALKTKDHFTYHLKKECVANASPFFLDPGLTGSWPVTNLMYICQLSTQLGCGHISCLRSCIKNICLTVT